jgi:integrase
LQAIRLLLFTGARLSEILTLEWSHVDLANGTIALPSRKGDGRKAHPVSQNVLQILSHLAETKCSRYVLPRDQDRDRHVSKEVVENAWQRIRNHADLDDVRLHDLRHTFGTFGGQAGGNAFLISHLLRHRNVTITHRYVNSDMDPIRGLSDIIGQRIADGLNDR